jgi:hypothetical protein
MECNLFFIRFSFQIIFAFSAGKQLHVSIKTYQMRMIDFIDSGASYTSVTVIIIYLDASRAKCFSQVLYSLV